MRIVALFLAIAASALASSQSHAETPQVVTDIPPIHSLVSLVIGDIGSADLLLSTGASPHDFSLKPSDATKLASANIIFYTSSTLTPWLSRVLSTLAEDTIAIELISSSNTITHPIRVSHVFPSADHDSHGHAHGEASAQGHADDVIDPHAWLDPDNAQQWIGTIASQMGLIDPANAETYQHNAMIAVARLNMITKDIDGQLESLRQQPFIVFHDSYQYFEERFDIYAKAAISLGDASQPGIKKINQLRDELKQYPGACIFSEPQFNQRLIKTVVDGMNVRHGMLDPLGAQLTPGAALYETLLGNLATSMVNCLNSQTAVDQ